MRTAKWGEGDPVTPVDVNASGGRGTGRPVPEGRTRPSIDTRMGTVDAAELLNMDGDISPNKKRQLARLRGLEGDDRNNVNPRGTAEEKIMTELKGVVVSDAGGNPLNPFGGHSGSRSAQYGFDAEWQKKIAQIVEEEVPMETELRSGSRWPNRIYVLKEAPHIAISVAVDYERNHIITIFAENLLGEEWADTLEYGQETAKSIGSTLKIESLQDFKDRTGFQRTAANPPATRSSRPQQSQPRRSQPQRRTRTLSEARQIVADMKRIRESGRTLSPAQETLYRAMVEQIRRAEGGK